METLYPLIIVDDEPLARTAISRMVTGKFPSFPVIGEADSGPGGVALFQEKHPPIVIMDIRIPGYDGLEASRIILKESPETQIIVLSAYDDFRFVQEALHHGVLGYLLKPVREDRLKELLDKAAAKIRDRESRAQEKQQVQTFRSIAVREQVASFIYGSKGGISAEEFAELSDPPIRSGYFLIFQLLNNTGISPGETRSIHRSLERMSGCLPGGWMGRYLPVFICMENNNHDAWRSEAEFLSREISHTIRSYSGSGVRSGTGPVFSDPKLYCDSFHMAFDALQESSEPREISLSGELVDRYPLEKEKDLLTACRAMDGTAALRAAESLSKDLVSPDISLMDARFAVTEFLIVFRREWESISGTPKRRAVANLLREALLCNEHEILREWFLLVVRDLIRNLSLENGGDDLLLRKVRHFIDLNDLREVSLESAAESIGITAPYLSRLFKEKTGQHFHDYVVDRRLDSAARLLRETGAGVGAIAEQVGYGDGAYFGKIFRKRYGSSPREYRRNG